MLLFLYQKAARNRAKIRENENIEDGLADETRLAKKLKTGKITSAEFEDKMNKLDKTLTYDLMKL